MSQEANQHKKSLKKKPSTLPSRKSSRKLKNCDDDEFPTMVSSDELRPQLLSQKPQGFSIADATQNVAGDVLYQLLLVQASGSAR